MVVKFHLFEMEVNKVKGFYLFGRNEKKEIEFGRKILFSQPEK